MPFFGPEVPVFSLGRRVWKIEQSLVLSCEKCLPGRMEKFLLPQQESFTSSHKMDSDEAYLSSPTTLATDLIDNLINNLVTTEDQAKVSEEEEDVDSGKDSSNITDSKTEDDSIPSSSDLDDDNEAPDEKTAEDISFLENWKMERQFDLAIQGLKKLKGEPVKLTKKPVSQPCEETCSDNDTFVISPFSDNQTYTLVKVRFMMEIKTTS